VDQLTLFLGLQPWARFGSFGLLETPAAHAAAPQTMRHVLFSLPGESTRILVRGRTNWQYVVSVFVCLLCATSGGSAHGLQHARAPTFAASENAALLGIARESDADVYGMGRVCGCQALQDCEDAAFAERKTGAEDDITGSVLRGGSGESDLVGQDGRIEMIIGLRLYDAYFA